MTLFKPPQSKQILAIIIRSEMLNELNVKKKETKRGRERNYQDTKRTESLRELRLLRWRLLPSLPQRRATEKSKIITVMQYLEKRKNKSKNKKTYERKKIQLFD